MESKYRDLINGFAKLSTNECSKMIGGFSSSYSSIFSDNDETNNCKGGNKKKGCGKKKRKKNKKAVGTNTNCSGNCVSGCGE